LNLFDGHRADIALLLLIAVFAFSLSSIGYGRIDARTYQHLLAEDNATPFHSALVWLRTAFADSVSGKELSRSIAALLPPSLAAASASLLFLALLPLGRFPSFAAALLYASSPFLLSNSLTGILLPETAGLFLFSISASLFLLSLRHPALALPAGLSSLLASLFFQPFIYAALALLAAEALSLSAALLRGNLLRRSIQPLLFLLPLLAFPAFAPLPELSLSGTPSPWALLAFGIAFCPLASSRRTLEENILPASLALLSLALSFSHSALALPGLALGAGFGLREGLSQERASGSWLILLIFFLFLSLLTPFLDPARTLALSAILTALAGVGLWMYSEKKALSAAAFYVLSLALLLASFHGLFAAQLIRQELRPETMAAFHIAASLPRNATVALPWDGQAFEFETGLPVLRDRAVLARYLLSNASASLLASKGVTHIILPMSVFDSFAELRELAGSGARIDSFAPTGRYVISGNNLYAEFSSPQGTRMYYPAEPETGNLVEGDVLFEDAGAVPSGRLLLLKVSNASGFSTSDRFIYPRSGFEANLLKLFFPENFGKAEGVREISREGGLLLEVGR